MESRSETTILGIGAWIMERGGNLRRSPLDFKNSDVIYRFYAITVKGFLTPLELASYTLE